MKRPSEAVLEERACRLCSGEHTNFVAMCLSSGREHTGFWARLADNSQPEAIDESIASALVGLDCCDGKHEVAS